MKKFDRFGKLILAAYIFVFSAGIALGQTAGNDAKNGVAGNYNGMIGEGVDPYSGNGRRRVEDVSSVAGAVGAYALKWVRTLNTRGTGVSRFGSGGSWRHSYDWGLSVTIPPPPQNPPLPPEEDYQGPNATVFFPDGKVMDFYGSDERGVPWYSAGTILTGEPDGPGEKIYFLCSMGDGHYDLLLTDGGRVEFRRTAYTTSTGGTVYRRYATAIVDPYGQTTTLYHDVDGKLLNVTEPGGRYLQINYQGQPGSVGLIENAHAYDGRGNLLETVRYSYTTVSHGAGSAPCLTRVDYDDGTAASYTCQPANTWSGNGLLVATCDDVRYAGAMKRIKYQYTEPTSVEETPRGQVWRERNLTTNQMVTEVVTPVPTSSEPCPPDPPAYRRAERRGDGAVRTFRYDDGCPPHEEDGLKSYTDFKGQMTTLTWSNLYPAFFPDPPSYAIYMKRETDGRGKSSYSVRDGATRALRRQVHHDGSYVEFGYADANHHYLAWRRDERGHITYFDRDANNRIWQTTYPDGGFEQFSYNGFGQVLTHRMTSGGTETFEYDEDGRGRKTAYYPPATPSDPNPWDHKTLYFYYESGPHTDRLLGQQDPRGNSTWYEYNLRGQVTKITHQDGSYVQNGYNGDGTLAWTADENHPNAAWNVNERTRYTYDEYKRVLTVTNPLNQTTTSNYALDWANPLVHTTGSVKAITLPSGKQTHFAYDENFRKILQVGAPGTAEAAWTWFGYDEVGNLISTTDPRNQTTTFGYDDRNRQTTITDALNRTTTTAYDVASNKTSVTRPNNPPLQFVTYDQMNRLKHQIDEVGVNTHRDYDHAGNLLSFLDGNGHSYVYEYDALNRRTKMIYPGGSYESTTYDWASNKNSFRNRAGNTQYFSYDNRNRQIWFAWDDGVTQPQLTVYDAASRITSIQNWEADITPTYDDANRRTSETETIKSYGLYATRSTVYHYDADGNRSRLIYPQGYQFTYEYTQRNQLANIRLDPAIFGGYFQTPVMQYGYDLSGNRVNRTALSGAQAQYDIDELNRVRAQANYFANGQMARYDYGFDELGRRRYEQRDWWQTDGFQFNERDELKGYQRDGTLNPDWTVSSWINTTVTYDNNGNRTQMTGSWWNTYQVNYLNQYTSDSNTGGMGYDGKGNLEAAAGWVYEYDAQNRVRRMRRDDWSVDIFQTYDGLNRVVTRNVNGAVTQNVWDGWNLIQEHRPDWSVQRCYLYGAVQNEMVAGFDGGVYPTTWHWQDGRGNTAQITGDDGVLLERYTYDLNGAPSFYSPGWYSPLLASNYDTRFLFGGSQYLPEVNVYDMRNRVYHVTLNRFLQTDPIGFAGDALNLYRYCGGDPVNRVDPMGLDPIIPSDDVDAFGRAAALRAEELSNNATERRGMERNIGVFRNAKGTLLLSTPKVGYRDKSGKLRSDIPEPKSASVTRVTSGHNHPNGRGISGEDRVLGDRLGEIIYAKGRVMERWRPDEDPDKAARHIGGRRESLNERTGKWGWEKTPNLPKNRHGETAAQPSTAGESAATQQQNNPQMSAASLDAALWVLFGGTGGQPGEGTHVVTPSKN